MPLASVADKARVGVPATISDRWKALMVEDGCGSKIQILVSSFPLTSEDSYSDDDESF
ncbi:unnamed protein product, partial [Sphagnum balticum]